MAKVFEVTFTEQTKYNPITRSVEVSTLDKRSAESIVLSQFGGSKHIKIDKVSEIKEGK